MGRDLLNNNNDISSCIHKIWVVAPTFLLKSIFIFLINENIKVYIYKLIFVKIELTIKTIIYGVSKELLYNATINFTNF